MLRLALISMLALTASGCATHFNDSAPAVGGGRYVVGQKKPPFGSPYAAAWHCPSEPGEGKGECEEVQIEFKE